MSRAKNVAAAGGASAPQVKRKWRPSLAMVVFAVLATVVALPLAGLFFFRIYENQLVRRTEAELIAQSAALAALLKSELRGDAPAETRPAAAPPSTSSSDPDGEYQPIEPTLDLADSTIMGPRADAREPAQPPDPAMAAIGRRMQPVLVETIRVTLAGLYVLDARGTVISGRRDVGMSLAHVEEVADALRGSYQRVLRVRIPNEPPPPLYSLSRGTRVRVFVAMPVLLDGVVAGVIYGSRTPTNVMKHFYSEQKKVIAVAAAIVGATLIIGFLFWRTITHPMHELIALMRGIGLGSRQTISPPKHHGTREIAQLSQGFLDMAGRLYDRSDYIATFAAHVSHELKSPLSSIQGAAELLRDAGDTMSDRERRKFLDNVIGDTERLTALVARLRELARADNPQTGGRTTLAPVVAAVRSTFSKLAVEAEGIDLAIAMSSDNALIVLSHLADNAARHNARTLRARASKRADQVVIEVANDGDPIAENNRDKIFTPFFTTRRESGGTGMGLEIVRSLLRAHAGTIRLLPGEGRVAFEIVVPAA